MTRSLLTRWPDDPMDRWPDSLVRPGTHETQVTAKAPRFEEGQPDVRQPEAGDGSAQEVVVRDARKQRVVAHKVILRPEGNPGEDKQEHSQLEAEDDVHDR